MDDACTDNRLTVGGRVFRSRLMVGTGIYEDFTLMHQAIVASGSDCVTVAMSRLPTADGRVHWADSLLPHIPEDCLILPNTAGAYTADEAIRWAAFARELFGHAFIKLEVLGQADTLFPDMAQTLEALITLVKEGFQVMVYCSDDPIYADRCQAAGAAAIMPLGSLIGSGQGVLNPRRIELLRRVVRDCPLIVDAGVGEASHATQAMELGVDGLLINTAIARARDPIRMARAMRYAVQAGRDSFLAESMVRQRIQPYAAVPTSPTRQH